MSLRARWQQWFFRSVSAEPAPIVLERRRVYILPTRAGVLYAAVLTAMYIGAINYNLGLGHALVFLLIGLGIVGMVHSYRNLAELEIVPGRSDPVFVGETIRYRIALRNPHGPQRFAIVLESGAARAVAPRLDTAQTVAVELPSPADRRGRRPVGRLRIRTRYPLGLFEAWSYPFPDASALVYPQPLYTPLPPGAPAADAGDVPGAEGEEDFAGFRARQPSDSPRHIAWKAFARDPEHQPLLVKTFAGGATPELWLDWRQATCTGDTDETVLSRLCGWVLVADRDGLRYGLRLPGAEIRPGEGNAHRDRCLERLALFETARSGP